MITNAIATTKIRRKKKYKKQKIQKKMRPLYNKNIRKKKKTTIRENSTRIVLKNLVLLCSKLSNHGDEINTNFQ